jgi:hypothetical protein
MVIYDVLYDGYTLLIQMLSVLYMCFLDICYAVYDAKHGSTGNKVICTCILWLLINVLYGKMYSLTTLAQKYLYLYSTVTYYAMYDVEHSSTRLMLSDLYSLVIFY